VKRTLLATLIALGSIPALAQPAATPAPAPAPVPTSSSAPPAEAAPPAERPKADSSWTEKVKLSARAYLRYSYELGEAARNANQFNVDRLYLQGEFFATDKVRFQLTLDAGATRNATGNQVLFAETKSAFIEVKDVLGPGLYLRAGILPLAWIPYEEDIWPYRVQGQLPMDRWGYITSADFGLALGGPLPSKYGSFQVNVVNGEGFRFVELGKRKELQARLTLNPLASMGGLPAGLFISGYGSYGRYDDAGLPAREKTRVIGQAGLQSKPLKVAVAYAVVRDANARVSARYTVGAEDIVRGQGIYAFAVLDVGELAPAAAGVDLLARYDSLDPDTDLENNGVNLFIAGVGYRWTQGIKSLLNYETVSYGGDVGGVDTNRPEERRIKVNTEFRF
jgi:hypothetical protein